MKNSTLTSNEFIILPLKKYAFIIEKHKHALLTMARPKKMTESSEVSIVRGGASKHRKGKG